MTPTYRYHKQSGQAVTDFFDPITGRKRCLTLGKWNSPESKQEHARVVAEVAVGRPGRTDNLSVAELCLAYLKFASGYYMKDGVMTDEVAGIKAAMKPLRELYAHTQAAEFGPIGIKAVQAKLIAGGMSRRVINKQVGRLRRVFRWAVGEAMTPPTVLVALSAVAPLKKGRTGAREKGPVLPVNDEVVEMTLPRLPRQVADMIRVQRMTGMRPNEVVQLRSVDIDRTAAVWLFRPTTHKTEHHDRDRVVAIGPRAQQILAPYLERDPLTYCFDPRETVAGVRASQTSERLTRAGGSGGSRKRKKVAPVRTARTAYDTDSYRRAIVRACHKAGVPQWSPNQLRHAYATEVRREFGLEAAQSGLGHSRADMTQVYAQKNTDLATEVARQIG